MTIGGHIGVGFHLPGIGGGIGLGGGIDLGGGIRLGLGGGRSKYPSSGNGGSDSNGGNGGTDPSTWLKIPHSENPHVQEVGKFAVDYFNDKYKNTLRFQEVYEAWIQFVDGNTKRFRLYLKVIDCLQRFLKFEAIVREEINGDVLQRTLESFDRL